jgi:hypothetical protein
VQRRNIIGTVITVLAVGLSMLVGTAPASAAVGDGYTWKDVATNRCLDGALTTNAIWTLPCDGRNSQLWQTKSVPAGIHLENDLATNMNACLSTDNSIVYKVDCGLAVSGRSQKWTGINGRYGVLFKSSLGKCLDSNTNGGVFMSTCNTSDRSQTWL